MSTGEDLYREQSRDWLGTIPWEDLAPDTKQFWEDQANGRREARLDEALAEANAAPNWISDLKMQFPQLFQGILPYHIACGEGWSGLLTQLCGRLDALALPDLKVVQIKEKFGGLRFYVEGGNGSEEVYALIQQAEAKAYLTCEACGAPAVGKRLERRCAGCLEKRKAREGGRGGE